MQIELYCTHCCCRLVAPPDTSAVDILDRMDDQGQGPWFGLGDGGNLRGHDLQRVCIERRSDPLPRVWPAGVGV